MKDNVDKTIDAICDWIQKEVETESIGMAGSTVTELTKALAELVSAKAHLIEKSGI